MAHRVSGGTLNVTHSRLEDKSEMILKLNWIRSRLTLSALNFVFLNVVHRQNSQQHGATVVQLLELHSPPTDPRDDLCVQCACQDVRRLGQTCLSQCYCWTTAWSVQLLSVIQATPYTFVVHSKPVCAKLFNVHFFLMVFINCLVHWQRWLGYLACKKLSPEWPIMCRRVVH